MYSSISGARASCTAATLAGSMPDSSRVFQAAWIATRTSIAAISGIALGSSVASCSLARLRQERQLRALGGHPHPRDARPSPAPRFTSSSTSGSASAGASISISCPGSTRSEYSQITRARLSSRRIAHRNRPSRAISSPSP